MEELRVLRERAKKNSQLAAAIKAEWLRGQLCGFYADDKIEHSVSTEFDHMTTDQLRQFIVEGTQVLGVDLLAAPKPNAKKH
jgi:hypothetical protein